MRHDDASNHAGADSPARLVHQLLLPLLIKELGAKCLW
jgi:hypothetical protein